MKQDTKTPQKPPYIYATGPPYYDPEAQNQPHYPYTSTSTSTYPYQYQYPYPVQKNPLKTWSQVRQEWRHGSKSRVIKYYLAYMLLGFIVGGIIGIVIGLIIRYA